MGRRGPKPKPTALREFEGDAGKQLSKRQREPKPQKATGVQPPTWLGAYAQAEWRRVAPELERLGLVTIVDMAALEIYCDLYGRWRHARTMKGNDKAVSDLAYRIKQYLGEFGLTPAGRVSIHADEPAPPPKPSDRSHEAAQAPGKVVDARRFFREA